MYNRKRARGANGETTFTAKFTLESLLHYVEDPQFGGEDDDSFAVDDFESVFERHRAEFTDARTASESRTVETDYYVSAYCCFTHRTRLLKTLPGLHA